LRGSRALFQHQLCGEQHRSSNAQSQDKQNLHAPAKHFPVASLFQPSWKTTPDECADVRPGREDAIVLSIESLGSDFAGWGSRYPEEKSKTDETLYKFFIHNRTRWLDIYMPHRGELDQNEIKRILGPDSPER
jgi:hypothetical protein